MAVNMIGINPLAIEICLGMADFEYPFNRMASFGSGWKYFPVIPSLFQKFCELGRPLFPDEGIKYLMDNCDERYREDKAVIRRGQKLYFDFCRELHTWGLLNRCPVLSSVRYQKVLDLSWDVDFVATPLLNLTIHNDMVAVQSMMRGHFPPDWTPENDNYNNLKRKRRRGRGAKEWTGLIFPLTNQNRRYYKSINRCWLFGPQHINDLAEEIRSKIQNSDDNSQVAIQLDFGFFGDKD